MLNYYRFSFLPFKFIFRCDQLFYNKIASLWNLKVIKNTSKWALSVQINNKTVTFFLPSYRLSLSTEVINDRQLLFLFRFFFELYAMRQQTLLFHASSIAINKKTYAFLGNSTYGKTTISKLLKPNILLGDDTLFIKNSKKTSFAFSSQFERGLKKNHRYSLACLFSLSKDHNNSISNLDLEKRVSLLLENNLLFLYLNNPKKTPFLEKRFRIKTSLELFKIFYNMLSKLNFANISFNLKLNQKKFLALYDKK